MGRLSRLRAAGIVLLAAALFRALACPVLADYQIAIQSYDLSDYVDLPGERMNILLVGTDTWEDVRDAGRSDTMIVCSYDTQTGGVRLLSLARDLLVSIPGGGGNNRLNAAHSFGGPNLLMKTVNQTFHLNVTRYVSLNIYGLWRIIDAMGGLRIRITPEEAREVNRMIAIEFPKEENPDCPSGDCVLSGLQAMTFARIRDLDSDFGRMARQRTVVLAIAGQVSGMTAEEQGAFLQACMANVSTNISSADILTMSGAALRHGLGEIEMLTLPRTGTYVHERLNGMSVLLSETAALSRDARAFLYGQEMEENP